MVSVPQLSMSHLNKSRFWSCALTRHSLSAWAFLALLPLAFLFSPQAAAQTAPTFESTQSNGQICRNSPSFRIGAPLTLFNHVELPDATGATTFTLAPSSPFGLNFDSATRRLTGTATIALPFGFPPLGERSELLATEAVTFTATNTAGSDSLVFNIAIWGPNFLTEQPDLTFSTGLDVLTTLPQASNDDRYTANLPPGLNLGGRIRRELSGTPTMEGTYQVTYRVTGATVEVLSDTTQTFTIQVDRSPDLTFVTQVADMTFPAGESLALTLPDVGNTLADAVT